MKDALAVNTIVMSMAPDVVPPARLKRRVMASVGVQPMSWSWLAALAAACMLIVALWLSVQERSRSSELAQARRTLIEVSSQRDRLMQALSFLDDPATMPVSFGKGQPIPPHGNVFVHSKLGVLLIAANLPAAQPGKTYEMWVIPKGGAPRPAGLFQSQGGTAMHILSGPLDIGTLGAVAVTLEPETGSSAPTSRLRLSLRRSLGRSLAEWDLGFGETARRGCVDRGNHSRTVWPDKSPASLPQNHKCNPTTRKILLIA